MEYRRSSINLYDRETKQNLVFDVDAFSSHVDVNTNSLPIHFNTEDVMVKDASGNLVNILHHLHEDNSGNIIDLDNVNVLLEALKDSSGNPINFSNYVNIEKSMKDGSGNIIDVSNLMSENQQMITDIQELKLIINELTGERYEELQFDTSGWVYNHSNKSWSIYVTNPFDVSFDFNSSYVLSEDLLSLTTTSLTDVEKQQLVLLLNSAYPYLNLTNLNDPVKLSYIDPEYYKFELFETEVPENIFIHQTARVNPISEKFWRLSYCINGLPLSTVQFGTYQIVNDKVELSIYKIDGNMLHFPVNISGTNIQPSKVVNDPTIDLPKFPSEIPPEIPPELNYDTVAISASDFSYEATANIFTNPNATIEHWNHSSIDQATKDLYSPAEYDYVLLWVNENGTYSNNTQKPSNSMVFNKLVKEYGNQSKKIIFLDSAGYSNSSIIKMKVIKNDMSNADDIEWKTGGNPRGEVLYTLDPATEHLVIKDFTYNVVKTVWFTNYPFAVNP